MQDPSVISLQHPGQYSARCQERSHEIDVENGPHISSINFMTFDVRLAGDTRAVDENIQSAELIADALDNASDLHLVRNIHSEGSGVLSHFFRGRRQSCFVDIQHCHTSAFSVQLFSDCQSQAESRTGDDGRLSLKFVAHRCNAPFLCNGFSSQCTAFPRAVEGVTLSFTLCDNQQRSKDQGFEESSAHDKIFLRVGGTWRILRSLFNGRNPWQN